MAKRQLHWLIAALMITAGGLQWVVGYATYERTGRARRITSNVITRAVIETSLQNLRFHLTEAEQARRDYLLHGQADITSISRSVAGSHSELAVLARLVEDPLQRSDFEDLRPLVEAELTRSELLNIPMHQRVDAAEQDRLSMDSIRRQLTRMERRQSELSAQLLASYDQVYAQVQWTVVWANLLSFLLMGAVLVILAWESRRRLSVQEQLRKSEENYRTLIENIPDVPWKISDEGALAYVGEGIEKITGYTAAELIDGGAALWRSRVHEEDMTTVDRGFDRLFKQGIPLDAQYRFQTKAGPWAWIYARASVVSVENGARYTQGLASDISVRRAQEEERARLAQALVESNRELEARNREVERATQLKSRFLANMSHELRTPLNAIMGFSELLADPANGATTERQKRWLRHIRNGSTHLLQLINDILDLSKIEADQIEFRPESVRLGGAIAEVMSIVRPLAQSRQVNLAQNIPKDLVVEVDRTRLKQIIYNLMSNAVKFTSAHGLVEIEARAFTEFICISVRDTGVGIRPEDRETIFEEFRQASATNKGVEEGTGLGLAITKRLVERQGGRMWLESVVGEGSRFSFTLHKGKELPRVAAADSHARLQGNNRSVLIVDDEPVTRELLQSHLRGGGFKALTAGTASEGLRIARESQPDAILLDVVLPDTEGWELLHQLKQDPRTKAIPVIIISIVDRKERGFSLGAADYLIKPVSREILVRTLHLHLKQARDAQILIVEDNIADQRVVSEVLGTHGFKCQAVASGKQGLEALLHGKGKWQMVVLDLTLPEMDGFEFLRRLKENEGIRKIPVVVLTGKDLTLAESDFLQAESQGLFRKGDAWHTNLVTRVKDTLSGTQAALTE